MRRIALFAFALSLAAAASAPAAVAPTIEARPTLVRAWQEVTLGGTFPGRRDDELAIEARWCGSTTWTRWADFHANADGRWAYAGWIPETGDFRLVYRSARSAPVHVGFRPFVRLQFSGGRFWVDVTSDRYYVGKRVVMQRRVGSRWVTVKTAVLRRASTRAAIYLMSTTNFTARVPRGSLVRASLSRSVTGRCTLASASDAIRIP